MKAVATVWVQADTRYSAMAEGEIKARATMPGAVAVKAVMGSTTKSERALIERYPDRRLWGVTIEYDMDKALAAFAAKKEKS